MMISQARQLRHDLVITFIRLPGLFHLDNFIFQLNRELYGIRSTFLL